MNRKTIKPQFNSFSLEKLQVQNHSERSIVLLLMLQLHLLLRGQMRTVIEQSGT